jgi:hypothetical protein
MIGARKGANPRHAAHDPDVCAIACSHGEQGRWAPRSG